MAQSDIIVPALVRRANQNALGMVLMIVAVVGFSAIPLLVARGGGSEGPFLFSVALRLGLGIGHAFFLAVFFGQILRHKYVLTKNVNGPLIMARSSTRQSVAPFCGQSRLRSEACQAYDGKAGH